MRFAPYQVRQILQNDICSFRLGHDAEYVFNQAGDLLGFSARQISLYTDMFRIHTPVARSGNRHLHGTMLGLRYSITQLSRSLQIQCINDCAHAYARLSRCATDNFWSDDIPGLGE